MIYISNKQEVNCNMNVDYAVMTMHLCIQTYILRHTYFLTKFKIRIPNRTSVSA